MYALLWERSGGTKLTEERSRFRDLGTIFEIPEACFALFGNQDASDRVSFYPSPEMPSTGCALVLGRIDNTHILQQKGRVDAPSVSDAQLLWCAYRAKGVAAFDSLKGHFSVILIDRNRPHFYLYRSHLIGDSLFYSLTSDWFVVASDEQTLLRYSAVSRNLDDRWLAGHFCFYRNPANNDTAFQDIKELLPGELLSVTRRQSKVTRQAPALGNRTIRYRSEQEYVDHFDSLVSNAVAKSIKGRDNLGIMLSSGLDSVPLAYWLARNKQHDVQATAYSWSLKKFPEADESQHIRDCAGQIGLQLQMIEGDRLWPLCQTDNWPLSPANPLSNPYRLLKEALYQTAADGGCRFLLNGNFGDALYPDYRYVLAEMIFSGRLERLPREFSYLLKHSGVRGLHRISSVREVVRRLLHWRSRMSIPTQYMTKFATGMIEWGQQWPPEAADHHRPHQYRGLLGLRTARGISQENYYTKNFGMQWLEPYVDWELVDFVLSTPSYMYWDRGESKVLMRKAMLNRIPDSVRTKAREGILDTFYDYGIVEQRADWIEDYLFRKDRDWPRFVKQEMIQRCFSTQQFPSMERALIWYCVTYEMWLDRYFR